MSASIQLKSNTLEGQAMEILTELNRRELSQTNSANNVRISVDLDSGILTGNVAFPIESVIDASGKMTIQTISYLT
ncbi:MAG: hypothetical protein ACRC80_08655 [Waterburya sp.]